MVDGRPRRILHGQGRALAGRALRRGRRGHYGVSRCWRGSSTTPGCSIPGWGRWRCPAPPLTTRAPGCCWRPWWRRPRAACSGRSWRSEAGWPTCCSWSTSAVRCSARLETWTPPRVDVERTGGLPIAHTSIVLLVVLAASWFTDVVGIYSVFGAFVAGAVMPRGALLDSIRERFEPLVAYLLLPAFFIYSGLNTQLSLILDPSTLLMAAPRARRILCREVRGHRTGSALAGHELVRGRLDGSTGQRTRTDGTHPAQHRIRGRPHLRRSSTPSWRS